MGDASREDFQKRSLGFLPRGRRNGLGIFAPPVSPRSRCNAFGVPAGQRTAGVVPIVEINLHPFFHALEVRARQNTGIAAGFHGRHRRRRRVRGRGR